MDKEKVNSWITQNTENFNPQDIAMLRDKLEKLNENQFAVVQATAFQKPDTIFLMAVFSLDRFFMEDVAMAVLKLITCSGCGVWWIIDLISAKERAKKYNFNKLLKVLQTTA